jgi:chemotaxis protein CheX
MLKINAKHVNPFVEAAMRVLTQVGGIEVRRGHLSYKEKVEPSFGISIIIGIYGFLTGMVVYSVDEKLADRLVDKLLEGKSPQQKKIMYLDTLGEVANMITGNATALLNQGMDGILSISAPGIFAGDDLSGHVESKPALVLGLTTIYGPIEISVAVEEQETLQEVGDQLCECPAAAGFRR